MIYETKANLSECPICPTEITVKKSSPLNSQDTDFFFVYCKHCWRGSNKAYDTADEALLHWQETQLLSDSCSVKSI